MRKAGPHIVGALLPLMSIDFNFEYTLLVLSNILPKMFL